MKGLRLNSIFKDNNALSGVIEALLLVALVAVILSTIQLIYIPEIMEQKENDHLDEVEKQITNLKSVIESQSMMGVIQSSESISRSPISSPITLGTDKLPYFITSRTNGYINIFDNKDTKSKIEILPAVAEYINGIPLTSVVYDMNSMYISYDIKYILEGGGIILNQTGGKYDTGEVMRVDPAMNIDNLSSSIKINYNIPVFDCPSGKNITAYSIDTSYVRTNYSNHVVHSDSDITHIRIYSDYLEGWNNCLLESEKGLLYDFDKYGYINVGFDNPSDPSYIYITPNSKTIDVEFTIVEIGIQTGTGTVVS